ncbi:hypothetical protein PVAND_006251 [Polypedilum vanderplanki]|uniref:RUN domain-containing protein n=1 Tax=Polypedilum vanderplanki TaxID=319348 RepID=A0A9J6C3E6_POLVA|nr:hypothetical protein PVAND_006251 [Polypedilum vanderplanki]
MEDNKNIENKDLVKMEKINEVLLKDLLKSVEEFINKRESEKITASTSQLTDLAENLKKIFYSRIKLLNKNGTPNMRKIFGFITVEFMNESIENQRLHFNKWLLENILKCKLSNFLSFILSDSEHINNFYESDAFIRSEVYQNALMKCVLALESNEKRHLPKIETFTSSEKFKPGHRRSISQPFISLNENNAAVARKSILSHMKKVSRTLDFVCVGNEAKVKVKLRRTKSLPNLSHESLNNRPRSKTINAQCALKFQKKVSFKNEIAKDVTEQVPFFDYKESLNLNKQSVPTPQPPSIHLVKVDDIKIHTDYRYSSEYKASLSSSPASSFSSKISLTPKRSSFFNLFETASDVCKISSPELSNTSPTDIFFTETVVSGSKIRSKSTISPPSLLQETGHRKKSSRQNLAHFIHTLNSSRHKVVELERENLHFHLSEAIIAACEQLKWNKMFNEKYKIPKDCRIKQSLTHTTQKVIQPPPKIRNPAKFTIGSVEDDTESSLSSDEVPNQRSSSSEDISIENTPQMEWTSSFDTHSAEGIAIALMSKFQNQKLPSANNLLWLVNETQAPQSLLPLPDSFPINPDENLSFNAIRGNTMWAAPRPQIIFTIHPVPDRKRQMFQQGNRCAGCGIKIAAAYIHKLRYCDYIGKYFCTACHKNQVSVIPARVLNKWDFALNPVSNFAYKWLDQIWSLPLFHVSDLNSKLYQKSKPLANAREARLQLKYVVDFIKQCRFAEKEQQEIMQEISLHWIEDVDIWSMNDFMSVKNSIFTIKIEEIIKQCEQHIIKNHCELCNARGFICELCPNKKDIIFPWMNKIKRCIACGSCYHEKCFTSQCSKCERLKRRRKPIQTSNFKSATTTNS